MSEFDFIENEKVAALDSVPEQFRSLYEPSKSETGDEIYVLSEVVRPLAEAYSGLARTYNETRGKVKSLNEESANRRRAVKGFEELATELGVEGEDLVDGFRSRIEEMQAQVKGGKELKINLDKIKADMERTKDEALRTKDEELGFMRGSLERYLSNERAVAAIAKHKGSIDLLLPLVRERVRVVQDGQDFVPRVVDESGDFRSDGKGGWMSVESLVEEMKRQPALARAFESEVPAGTGSQPGAMARRAPTTPETKNANQKIAAGLEKKFGNRP